MKKKPLYVLATLLVLMAGILIASVLVAMRARVPKDVPVARGQDVSVVTARRVDSPVAVAGFGEVRPATSAQIVSQVAGRVVQTHANLKTGGYIPAGQPLLKIDDADYQIAVRSAEAQLATAQAAVATAESGLKEGEAREAEARRRLENTRSLFDNGSANQRELDQKQLEYDVAAAQMSSARAARASAEAQITVSQTSLDRAKLDLMRTQLTLPFDAVISSERVDVGQYVVPGESLGQAYGTAAMEITVPMEDRELQWLPTLPMPSVRAEPLGADESYASATVRTTFAGRECEWPGRVVRIEGEVDSRSRMVRLIVRVDHPFAVNEHRPPLMPGAFVTVSLEGRTLKDVIELPRAALRDGNRVWVVEEGRLRMKDVVVERTDRRSAYIRSGLEPGQQVIISTLNIVTEGMLVNVPEASSSSPSSQETQSASRAVEAEADAAVPVLKAGEAD